MGLQSYGQGTLTLTTLNVAQSLTVGAGIGTLGSYFAEFDISALANGDTFQAYIVSSTLLGGTVNQLTNDSSLVITSTPPIVKKYTTGVGVIWTQGDIFVIMTAGSVAGKTFPFRIGVYN